MPDARDDVAERYRIGIVGLDHWYVGLAAAEIAARDPGLELVAIAHRDPVRLQETATRFGARHATPDYRSVAIRDDVDFVVTACPTSENADLVVAAANAGKHIVSVKPIVPDTDTVLQKQGEDYLHISVRYLDGKFAAALAKQYQIDGARFSRSGDLKSSERAVPLKTPRRLRLNKDTRTWFPR